MCPPSGHAAASRAPDGGGQLDIAPRLHPWLLVLQIPFNQPENLDRSPRPPRLAGGITAKLRGGYQPAGFRRRLGEGHGLRIAQGVLTHLARLGPVLHEPSTCTGGEAAKAEPRQVFQPTDDLSLVPWAGQAWRRSSAQLDCRPDLQPCSGEHWGSNRKTQVETGSTRLTERMP